LRQAAIQIAHAEDTAVFHGYRAGGIAGVIQHEVDGLLVRCGDVAALAEALARYAADPELRRKPGRLARRRCEEQFDIRACAAQYRRVLVAEPKRSSVRSRVAAYGGTDD
jgi:hypothetical protein